MNLDGTNRTVVQDLTTHNTPKVPFGIGAFDDKVYYIDRTRYDIFIYFPPVVKINYFAVMRKILVSHHKLLTICVFSLLIINFILVAAYTLLTSTARKM